MKMPSGSIYLINKKGEKENVMIADISDSKDFLDEVCYILKCCNYDINEYKEAIYYNDYSKSKIKFRIIIDDLIKSYLLD